MLLDTMKRRAPVVLVASAVVLAGMSLTASPGTARPLPPGCNLGYQGQAISTFVGRATTFQFEMYNAVPPGHTARAVRITWGDGKRSRGKARTRSKPYSKGCYVTHFSGRHTYTHIRCTGGGGVCNQVFKVMVRYRDAQTGARHLMNKLRVIVIRRGA